MMRIGASCDTSEGCVTRIGGYAMLFPGVTLEQMRAANEKYMSGAYIQDAYNFLTSDQRDFLMTGLTPGQWDELFAEEEE